MPPRARRKLKVIIRKLKDSDERRDYEYWMSRTPQERLEAVEFLRVQWYKMHNERPKRLRRIHRAFKRA